MSKLPVVNVSGACVGFASRMAHKQASALAGAASMSQEFRVVEGRRRLCWVPSRFLAA
jgi:hypothetical protein